MKLGIKAVRLHLVVAVACLVTSGPLWASNAGRAGCFNLEDLTPELRAKSESYLLQALDTEHLYTIAGGMKPMSGGFFTALLPMEVPTTEAVQMAEGHIRSHAGIADRDESQERRLASAQQVLDGANAWKEVEDLRTILATWRCGGEIYADVVHYASPRGAHRSVQGVVFNMPSLRTTLGEKQGFFGKWALTPNSNPVEVIMAVENADGVSRYAGYGYLFGYPDEAVKFFATASASQEATGQFVEREARAIPTFQREAGQFTYAVPKGAPLTEADIAMRARASVILAAYTLRRAEFIGPGKPGPAALLRDWFCDADDRCSPSNAAR